MTQTTTTYEVTLPLSKKDILQRLYDAGHISFDELWFLAQETYMYPWSYTVPAVEPLPYNTCNHT